MSASRRTLLLPLLNNVPLALFALVLLGFGLLSPQFLTPRNLVNLLVQTAPTCVVAVGMTFVLLTGGVDLSVGAIMFVAAALGGKLLLAGGPPWLALLVMCGAGLFCGCVNALLVTRLQIMAFIATLGSLYVGRGCALWITRTRAMNLPPELLALGGRRLLGLPLAIVVCGILLALAWLVLNRTPFGRQIYATGHSVEQARRAGVNTGLVLAAVYAISGLCAGLGGILSLAQLGAVSPMFGNGKEFSAIAAAVLGGTSLFGGRGNVLPGTLLGALLIQAIENGLVIVNADPYVYPLVTAGIVFVAVLSDSLRTGLLARLTRRTIRMEEIP